MITLHHTHLMATDIVTAAMDEMAADSITKGTTETTDSPPRGQLDHSFADITCRRRGRDLERLMSAVDADDQPARTRVRHDLVTECGPVVGAWRLTRISARCLVGQFHDLGEGLHGCEFQFGVLTFLEVLLTASQQ